MRRPLKRSSSRSSTICFSRPTRIIITPPRPTPPSTASKIARRRRFPPVMPAPTPPAAIRLILPAGFPRLPATPPARPLMVTALPAPAPWVTPPAIPVRLGPAIMAATPPTVRAVICSRP
ncbi:MAG: hypothetical protein B7Z80_20685 [Rhodospirillales bacterium 20-64-7]|nr:MAG: hypothetical protein B7Z80_20685 [Rhodospirillales bacterium 20-64-7]